MGDRCVMNSEDMRIIKTKEALRKAMVQLLTEMSFEKMSVQDICEKAKVHRTTLYKHFADKYDLFSYVLTVMKNEIYSDEEFFSKDFKTIREVYYYLFDKMLTYIDARKDKLKKMARNILNEPIFASFVNFAQKKASHFIKKHPYIHTKCPTDIMSHFLTGGMIYVVSWWLENPKKYTKNQILEYIDKTIISSLTED